MEDAPTQLTAMSTTNRLMLRATFQVCGLRNSSKIEIRYDQHADNVFDLHGRLLRSFNIDDDLFDDYIYHYDLLWHHKNEPCHIQRPLTDLITTTSEAEERPIVHLHPSCSSIERARSLAKRAAAIRAKQKLQRKVSVVEDDEKDSGSSSEQQQIDRDIGVQLSDEPTDQLPNCSDRTGAQLQLQRTEEVQDQLTSNAGIQAAKITVLIKFKSANKFVPKMGPMWTEAPILVSLDCSFTDLANCLRDQTSNRLRDDGNWREFPMDIIWRPIVELVGEKGLYATYDTHGEAQIQCLGDLFPNGNEKSVMPITIRLWTDEAPCDSTAEEKLYDCFSDAAEHYYIGDLDDKEAAAADYPARRHAIVGRFVSYRSKATRTKIRNAPTDSGDYEYEKIIFEAYSTPMWFANGQWLGYAHPGIKLKVIPSSTTVDNRYGMKTRSLLQLGQFIQEPTNAAAKTSLHTDVPLRPNYSFENASIMLGEVGLQDWPQHTIYLVGPFKQYIDQSDTILGSFRIELRKECSLDGLHTLLDQQLQKTPRGKGYLMGQAPRKWKYRLWVLPQKENNSKMLTYNVGGLTLFMCADRLHAEQELYMEAHVLPVELRKE